jgi:hypothetical protein
MFTIPDKGEGLNDIQSILFQEYIDILVKGIAGISGVVSGCEVTAPSGNMTVSVAAGQVIADEWSYAVNSSVENIAAADATNPRLDLVVVKANALSVEVRTGTPSATPKPPAAWANDVVVAVVYVPAGATVIAASNIVDLRVFYKPAIRLLSSNIASGSYAIAAQDLNGKLFGYNGTGDATFTLPFASAVASGSNITIRNYSAAGVLTVSGSSLYGRDVNSNTSFKLFSRETITLVAVGSSWFQVGSGLGYPQPLGADNSKVFFENDTTVTADYTITTGKNAMSAGPIEVAAGVTVTVPDGSTWSIV